MVKQLCPICYADADDSDEYAICNSCATEYGEAAGKYAGDIRPRYVKKLREDYLEEYGAHQIASAEIVRLRAVIAGMPCQAYTSITCPERHPHGYPNYWCPICKAKREAGIGDVKPMTIVGDPTTATHAKKRLGDDGGMVTEYWKE